jgi:hypothetical protein
LQITSAEKTSSKEVKVENGGTEVGLHRAEESRSVGEGSFEKRQGMILEDGEDQLAMESNVQDQVAVESGQHIVRDQMAVESNSPNNNGPVSHKCLYKMT